MGVIGLTTFLLFAFSALKHIHAASKSHPENSLIPKVMFVYFAATLIEFLTIYSFIGDIKWGVLLGLLRTIGATDENSD